MDCTSTNLSYEKTGFFSKIVLDYLNENLELKPFYQHPVSMEGIKAAIAERKIYPTNRQLLLTQLEHAYHGIELTAKQEFHLKQIENENCFTVTTAHQPNIFTGHLYFIYKILHAIQLAGQLQKEIPEYHFIPVFYMGSEDADLDELGHIYLFGEKYVWKTAQKGAVGRMKVDKALVEMIATISGQLTVHPFGKELIDLLKTCYNIGNTIEQATFKLINTLFAEYGLIILLPDQAELKRAFIPIIEKEIDQQFSHQAVNDTVSKLPKKYKVQAGGRELNLFYLKDDIRERIELQGSTYKVHNTAFLFSKNELVKELVTYPERFSPNVILRPLFQEMILPNVVFIGGGGEIAYWLELKEVFAIANIPFPVLVLRNSFLIIEKKQGAQLKKLGFSLNDLFKTETDLLEVLVKRDSTVQLNLDKEKASLLAFYSLLKDTAGAVDMSLVRHTEALQVKALKKIEVLEKKMLRAGKKKFEVQQIQINKLKTQLFPNNVLQERVENMLPYYAKWGKEFIRMVYENSLGLEQDLVILEEK